MSKMVKHFAGASLALVLLCGNALAAGNEVRLPVEKAARQEGIDKVFEEAGFMLRLPGCSACLGMNEDKIPPGP